MSQHGQLYLKFTGDNSSIRRSANDIWRQLAQSVVANVATAGEDSVSQSQNEDKTEQFPEGWCTVALFRPDSGFCLGFGR